MDTNNKDLFRAFMLMAQKEFITQTAEDEFDLRMIDHITDRLIEASMSLDVDHLRLLDNYKTHLPTIVAESRVKMLEELKDTEGTEDNEDQEDESFFDLK